MQDSGLPLSQETRTTWKKLRLISINQGVKYVRTTNDPPITIADIFWCILQAAAFPVSAYTYSAITQLFDDIKKHDWGKPNEKAEIRAALWNAGSGIFKTFLEVTEEDINDSVQNNIVAAFAFSRQAVLTFKDNEIDEKGRRGTLIFTGATASIRGNVYTSAFAAGKHGLRALSQSLAKEFGKQNIHVSRCQGTSPKEFILKSDTIWHE